MKWHDYFTVPYYRYAQIASCAPHRGVLVSDIDGRFNAYAWDRSKDDLVKISATESAILDATISQDGEHVYYLQERDPGSEKGHIVRVPFAGGEAVDITPDLTDYFAFSVAVGEHSLAISGVDDDGSFICVVDDAVVHQHRVDASMGEVVLSADGKDLLLTDFLPGHGVRTRVRRVDPSTGEVLGMLPFARANASVDGVAIIELETGDWSTLAEWLPSGDTRPIPIDLQGDIEAMDVSGDGQVLLVRNVHRSIASFHLYDRITQTLESLRTPGLTTDSQSRGSLIDATSAVVTAIDAGSPPRPVVATADGWAEALSDDHLASFDVTEWTEANIPSTEESTLHGWLLTPSGTGPWPTVLYTHGGPTFVQSPDFNPFALAFVSEGYAFLSINYRGSTTYGTEYREALSGNIGGPDIDDVASAARWLIAEGIAEPETLVKCGYSYGGYLTLQATGKHPDLFVAGLAGAAISDWTQLYELSPMTRGYCDQIFDGSPDEVSERYADASPITRAAHIRTPIIISQPENDARTPFEPIAEFADAVTASGGSVRLERLSAGHTGAGTDQMIEMVDSWLRFAEGALARASSSPHP